MSRWTARPTATLISLVALLIEAAVASAQSRARFDIRIPMRDGVHLSADAWLPADTGRYPVILLRTPYIKTVSWMKGPSLGAYFALHGYALVIQDVRGRGDSDGSFGFFFAEATDGYDTIEWLAAQPWTNGRVGTMGASYMGTAQWLAARERPPHLICMVSTAAAGRYFDEIPYQGGALVLAFLAWTNGTSGHTEQDNDAVGLDWPRIYAHRPLRTMDEAMGRRLPLFRDFLLHPTLDAYWRRIQFDADDFRRIALPVLHVTGWFDGDQPGAMFYWRGMRAGSPARDQQFLLAGPWTHEETFFGGSLRVGEVELPGESVIDARAEHLAFFDHFLKGDTARYAPPRARIFVTGDNVWRTFDEFPPHGIEMRELYLHGGGRANSLSGDGVLGWTRAGAELPDHFTFDPRNPVPSDIGGVDLGADHRPIERRDDVLVFTSDALARPLQVIGPVEVTLHAASDALDTDFTAKLLDVYPDGRAVKLGPKPAGIIRARHRHGAANGYSREELLTPGNPEAFRIALFDLAHTFLPGHRIRLEVSSSAFPWFAVNQNTGAPIATDTTWKVAHQTVFHDTERPSAVRLSVMKQ